jgi:hypothetical protein
VQRNGVEPECAVVVVRVSADGRCAVGVSGDADPAVFAELRRVAVESRGNLPLDVWRVARQSGSKGIALLLVAHGTAVPEIPEPLPLLFEPVTLDERDPRFAEFASVWEARRPARRRGRAVSVLKWVLAGVLAVADGLVLIGPGNGIGENVGRVILSACTAGAIALVVLWRRGRILIAPGAVVIERWGFLGGGTLRLTPSNSVLIAKSRDTGWDARIWQGWKSYGDHFSELEFKALLAAWRSPAHPADS